MTEHDKGLGRAKICLAVSKNLLLLAHWDVYAYIIIIIISIIIIIIIIIITIIITTAITATATIILL